MTLADWAKIVGPILLEILRIIFKSPKEAVRTVKEKRGIVARNK